ncbi:gliding motility-associated C-terminal domain-containing protein [Leeuwenhoekiella sp. MAR_2009_132]|uniref:gliding motility-associated C-terminal domain-containing protein n=1 Tax=Leeuwenhoekiella sp. MAR_2009_132 TaxID=1392489 RepID=UPI00048CE96B|nr:T9SS C-terminal target domain-containing protein [Leeuwenhoekiella sp. MAR_2009_132]
MHKKITFLGKAIMLSFLFISFGFSTSTYAQCAGEDATLSSCNKETNQFLDLFAALGGSPTPGGTWTDNDNTGGLNEMTGELNTWQISSGGSFTYTYTNPNCSESATVTLTLAGFPGQSNMNAVACDDNSSVNLFQFTGGSPAATTPGNWTLIAVSNERGDDVASASNSLSGRNFDASQAGKGTYTFRYTITDQPAIDCQTSSANPSPISSMVRLEVSPAPDSGNLDPNVKTIFCETDDLSGFRNYNLRTAIINEDDGGFWTENKTGEITSATDSFINIERIRDTYGVGTYSFTYTVEPVNQICNESEITVNIVIEQVADFRNAILEFSFPAEDEDVICVDTLPITPIVTITGAIADIPNGNYEMTYSVSPSPNAGTETVVVTMTDGVGTFNANTGFFTGVGVAELVIESIKDPNTFGECITYLGDLRDTLTIVGLPDLSDALLEVDQPLCLEENGTFTISDAGSTSELELIDGNYSFTYTLANSTTSMNYTQTADVLGGTATITLPATALLTADDYTITLTNATNYAGCSSDVTITSTFTVSPKPDAQTLSVSVTDACENETVTVTITDTATTANLTDGTYDFTYDLTGAITLTNQSATGVVVTNGKGSFILPATILANGNSNLTLTSIANSLTACEADNLTMPAADFNITPIPDLTNAVLTVVDVCEDKEATLTINVAPTAVQDGSYTLSYTISGANTLAQTNANVTFTAGVAILAIAETSLTNAGTNTITILSLATATLNCAATGLPISQNFETLPVPTLTNTTVSVASVCLGEGSDILFTNSDLTDGTYEIEYELTGANMFSQTATITFLGGSASLSLDALTLANAGTTTLTIKSITSTASTCINDTSLTTSFEVNPIPELADESVTASDICVNEPGLVSIANAADLTDGTYTVTYDLSGTNTASGLSATVTVTNGTGLFEIPATALTQTGITTIDITQVTSASNCASGTLAVSDDFEIYDLPDATGVVVTGTDVCFGEPVSVLISGASALVDADYLVTYALSGANTVQSVTATLPFTAGAATLSIDSSVLISAGVTTIEIIDIQNFTTLCSASNVTANPAVIALEDPTTPSLTASGNVFCVNDDPTVADLLANASSSFDVLVYDAATGGSLVSSTTALSANTTYYLAAQNSSSGCESSQRLAVTADLTGCDSVFIPDGFSPNGDGINDLFEMKNIDIIYPNYTIEIFNRNGNVVFKGNASSGFWNGQANQNRLGGNTLPNGTYFYIINYNNGQTNSKQGKVYLNR